MRSVIVTPVIMGAFRNITKKLDEWLENPDITLNTALLQKTTILGTDRILRKVPEY